MTRLESTRRSGFSMLACAATLAMHGCAADRSKPPPTRRATRSRRWSRGCRSMASTGSPSTPRAISTSAAWSVRSTYRVDPESGSIEIACRPPDGCADDMEFGPDGRLYWTQLFGRQVVAAAPDGGAIQVLAKDRTGINSIAFKQDGRLFATEVFDGDALYEIDPKGEKEPRLILKDLGGLNGFDFGPDGKLYGPLWFKAVSGARRRRLGRGRHGGHRVRDAGGRELRLEGTSLRARHRARRGGERRHRERRAQGGGDAEPGLDNLAFDPKDRLFVTNMANNGIYEVDTETGSVRTVVEGKLAVPAALDLVEGADGREVLHVADTFAYRTVDVSSGEVKTIGRVYQGGLINPLGVAVGANQGADHLLLPRRRRRSSRRAPASRGEARARDAVRGARARRRSLPGRRDRRRASWSRCSGERRGARRSRGAGRRRWPWLGGREPRLRSRSGAAAS